MEDQILHWAALEFAPWRGVRLDGLARRQRSIAAASPSIFLFHAADGQVAFEAKPGADPLHLQRAELYRAFFERTIRDFAVDARGSFLIGVHDRGHSRYDVPVFEYQKQRGADTMLLPDVDLLAMGFLADECFEDGVAFADKKDEAIFVGSTTGGIISAATVHTLEHPRLRAAVYFKDKPGITFELPVIVQCDSPETEALVAALDVGGRRRTWAEQFCYKYLLSIDGNGANCSRVALALRSHSLLVKYNSPWQLFYFHGLEAWHHYLPVRRDDDVVAILGRGEDTAARDATIVANANAFAREYISEQSCRRFTADLLRQYFAQFDSLA